MNIQIVLQDNYYLNIRSLLNILQMGKLMDDYVYNMHKSSHYDSFLYYLDQIEDHYLIYNRYYPLPIYYLQVYNGFHHCLYQQYFESKDNMYFHFLH